MRASSLALFSGLVLGFGLTGRAVGQSTAAGPSAAARPDEVSLELARLPHFALMNAVTESLGAQAPQRVRLSADQTASIQAAHNRFAADIRKFVLAHADDPSANVSNTAEDYVPSREAAENAVLHALRPDQRAYLDPRLREVAVNRLKSRAPGSSPAHAESNSTVVAHPSDGVVTKSDSKTSSSSSHDSDHHSASDSNSQSSHDSHSDSKSSSSRQSDSKSASDRHSANNAKSDGHSSHNGDSRQSSSRKEVLWSSLDRTERKAALTSLLDQLDAADRAKLANDAGLGQPNTPPPSR